LFSKNNKKVAVHIAEDKIFIAVAEIKNNVPVINYLNQLPLDENKFADIIKTNKLKNYPVYLALGGKQIVCRIITIPEISEVELRKALQWEVTKYIPIPPEDLLFDFEILEKLNGPNGKQIRIMIVAARKKYVEDYCNLLVKVGLKPKLVDIEGSLLKYIYLNLESKVLEENVCCIYLDDSRGVFSFIKDNEVFFIHNVDWENELISRFISEYQRVSSYLQRQFQIEGINNIFIIGPMVNEDIAKNLQDNININVKVGKIRSDKAISFSKNSEQFNSSYLFCIGLLLREVE